MSDIKPDELIDPQKPLRFYVDAYNESWQIHNIGYAAAEIDAAMPTLEKMFADAGKFGVKANQSMVSEATFTLCRGISKKEISLSHAPAEIYQYLARKFEQSDAYNRTRKLGFGYGDVIYYANKALPDSKPIFTSPEAIAHFTEMETLRAAGKPIIAKSTLATMEEAGQPRGGTIAPDHLNVGQESEIPSSGTAKATTVVEHEVESAARAMNGKNKTAWIVGGVIAATVAVGAFLMMNRGKHAEKEDARKQLQNAGALDNTTISM